MAQLYISLLLLLSPLLAHAQKRSSSGSGHGEIIGRRVTKTLQFLSPLQSLTIFPKEESSSSSSNKTPRDEFLPKFQAGLTAETKTKTHLAKRRELEDGYGGAAAAGINTSSPGWEKRMEERERQRAEKEEELVDRSWDRATAPFFEKRKSGSVASTNAAAAAVASKYQFVGVIQPPDSEQKVKWYARKRPKDSKWNIRMVHVNRDAIIRDMFTSGKVDIMGKYVNTGEPLDEVKEGEVPSLRPRIKGEYSVKPRLPW